MIKTFLVDDELPALYEMQRQLEVYPEISVDGMFTDPEEALEKIEAEAPDAVFLDIDMPRVNGIELAQKIQALHFGITIIFVTAYSEYSLEAYRAFPLDYLLKPVEEDRLQQTMEHLKEQCRLLRGRSRSEDGVFIRCFGKMEIIKTGREESRELDGETGPGEEMLRISNRKVKELLAYLLYRFGKPVSRQELVRVLFDSVEDKKTVNHLHVTVYNLRKTLEGFGVHRRLITLREDYALEVAPGVCDYVDLVNFIHSHPVLDRDNCREAERLVKLYRGPFLEGEDYLWLPEVREEVEEMVEGLFFRLAEHLESAGEIGRAEQVMLALLELNRYCEEAHHFLMDLYLDHYTPVKFLRQYEKYRKIMEELQLEPEEKYRYLFQRARKEVEGE